MSDERHWIAAVPEQTYVDERLYAHDVLVLPADGVASPLDEHPRPGDPVALVALAEVPLLFGLGRAQGPGRAIGYTHRLLDDPVPVEADVTAGLKRISANEYQRLTALVATDRPDAGRRRGRSEWFVTVAIPIEAASAGEAVREFWTYVDRLGPRELPAFVWPRGDELAMQAFVLGEPANQDPEEDD